MNIQIGFLIGALMFVATLSIANAAESENDSKRVTVLPNSAGQWKEAALADVSAAAQEMLNNHPGVYDPQNPEFQETLQLARNNALAIAEKVTDAAGYIAAISTFTAGLHDGHAGAFTNLEQNALPASRWPGFLTVWRGDGLFVYGSESQDIPVGAKILTCDGRKINDLILANVYAFGGRSEEPGSWWSKARWVFIDGGNPFVKLPKQCQIENDGRMTSVVMKWGPTDENFKKWRDFSYNGDALPVGLTEPRSNLLWIAMPTFQPDEAQQDAYFNLSKEIEKSRERVQHADAIVIDLRQNQGGSSIWSKQFAESLWGKSWVDRVVDAYESNVEIWWRTSQDNTDYVMSMVDVLKKQKQSDIADMVANIGIGMQAARLKGEKFYVEHVSSGKQSEVDPMVDLQMDSMTFMAPVYVVVPGQCASACLDALDVFTRFPNTRLIGAPSSADSTYMEVRYKLLPSGLASAVIPNKMWVHRPRAKGQVYMPAITVTDLEWTTANILKVVESDLSKKR